MSTLKSRYNDLWLRVEFCTSFSFIYNTIRQRQTQPATSAENIGFGGLNFTYLFQTAEIQAQRSTKAEVFPREFYSEIYSPSRTLAIICIMALTLQPIRGCPQHSEETGTRLLSAIHRCLFSRFFLREGGHQYTGYSVHASCFLVISLMSTAQ